MGLPEATISTNASKLWKGRIKSAQIPSTTEWRWNQSKGRQTIKLEDGSQVQVIKYIPRSRARTTAKAPSYKLWICEFSYRHGMTQSATWCERGLQKNPEDCTSEDNELCLEDYQFLAVWMPSTVANELWPSIDIKDSMPPTS